MNTGPITNCLSRLRAGDANALDQLFPLIYDELKIVARAQLTREQTGHTLGPTALVHEAYVRMADREKLVPEDRRHFFAIAAQTMRRILIDHARSRKRVKRGSGQIAVSLEEVDALMTENAADELIALDDALDRLAAGRDATRVRDQVDHRAPDDRDPRLVGHGHGPPVSSRPRAVARTILSRRWA